MAVAVSERRCAAEGCEELLPRSARVTQRFCSRACRQRMYARRRRDGERDERAEQVRRLEEMLETATSEPRLVAIVARAAGAGSWRAACWILERKFRERWSSSRIDDHVPVIDASGPFAEVDELARRRRAKLT
jgi:hypothetical protein